MKHIFLTDSSELWMKFIPHRNVAQGPQIETVKKTRTETNYSTERNDELGNIFSNGVKRRQTADTNRKKKDSN